MIDPKSKYTVLHDDNSVFVDLTEDAADLTRDNVNIGLVAAEDYIYVGLDKPFGALYIEMVTPNANANTFAAEIFDGTSFVSIDLTDESRGMTRSGFMYWDKTSMTSTTINGIAKCYIRLKPSADHSASVLRGLNLVFSDDASMKQEFIEIDNANLLPPGEVSHIGTHVASRNYILHNLRNHYVKSKSTVSSGYVVEKINQFDLIDIFEVREAATFLALSKIFFNLSDNPEDHWWSKYREYQDKFEEKMVSARLSIDTDDDGVDSASETQKQYNATTWTR